MPPFPYVHSFLNGVKESISFMRMGIITFAGGALSKALKMKMYGVGGAGVAL